MLKKERLAYTLQQLNLHYKVLLANLCRDVSVSDDTIRRDIYELPEEGKLIKVQSGTLSNTFHKGSISFDLIYFYYKKATSQHCCYFDVSDNDWNAVQIKKTKFKAAKKVQCMTISEKINTEQHLKVWGLNKIDFLITVLAGQSQQLYPT